MQSDPPILPYARAGPVERWSWKAAAGCAVAGAIAAPLAVLSFFGAGFIGVVSGAALPIVVGTYIGRRTRATSHLAGYTASFGLGGSLLLTATAIVLFDGAPPVVRLSTYSIVAYSLVFGMGLWALAFVFGRSRRNG